MRAAGVFDTGTEPISLDKKVNICYYLLNELRQGGRAHGRKVNDKTVAK